MIGMFLVQIFSNFLQYTLKGDKLMLSIGKRGFLKGN